MTAPEKIYTCIIVDDKQLDRILLQSYLEDYPFLKVIGSFPSARQALEFLETTPAPDALFLDIDMPGMNGLTLRSRLDKIAACVFVTSHPEFAVESFEMAALDYLLKPLKADRIKKMMLRLEDFLSIHAKAHLLDHTLGENTLFIKDGYSQVKLQMQEIVYLEALKDYTGIITKKKKYCVLSPLGTLLKEKTFQHFIRIHRSYAIHRHSIREISSKGILVNDVMVPVGRSYKETVERLFSA